MSKESLETRIHRVLWREYQRTTTIPNASWLAKDLDLDRGLVSRHLRALLDAGVLEQPYGTHGPYRLKTTPDGNPIEHKVEIRLAS